MTDKDYVSPEETKQVQALLDGDTFTNNNSGIEYPVVASQSLADPSNPPPLDTLVPPPASAAPIVPPVPLGMPPVPFTPGLQNGPSNTGELIPTANGIPIPNASRAGALSPKPDAAPHAAAAGSGLVDGLTPLQTKTLKQEQDINNPYLESIQKAAHDRELATYTATETLRQKTALLDQQKQVEEASAARKLAITNEASKSTNEAIAQAKADAAAVKDIDPDRRSVPSKILGAVAMAFGGYGAGITHSRNFAQDIISEQVKNDVEAQKANIDKAWKKISFNRDIVHDKQAESMFKLDQEDRISIKQRSIYNDQIAHLADVSGNADHTSAASEMMAASQGEMARIQMTMQQRREAMLHDNAAKAGAVAASERARADKLSEREDKYIEHRTGEAGGGVSPERAAGEFSERNGGPKYVPNPNEPQSGGKNNFTDSSGVVRKALNPQIAQAAAPELTALRIARHDADAYEANPTQGNYDRLVLSTGQSKNLKRAPGTASGIGQGIKQMVGLPTGNTVADSIPSPAAMRTGGNLKDYRASLDSSAREIESGVFGPPPPVPSAKETK